MSTNLHADITRIIRASASAPSGDNMQPWRFVVRGNTIEVFLTHEVSPQYLFGINGVYLSHGALIETLVIAADHYGYRADVEILPDDQDPLFTARIELHPDPVDRGVELFDFLSQRETHRGSYKRTPLPDSTKAELESAARLYLEQTRVLFVENKKDIAQIATAVAGQVKMIFWQKTLHREFFSKLRWTTKQALETRDGLDTKTLAIDFFKKLSMRFVLRFWFMVRTLNGLGAHTIAAQLEKIKNKQAGAYFVLIHTQKQNINKQTVITAGRLLQRTWLMATKHHVALQPAAALLLLTWNLPVSKGEYSAKQIAFLQRETARIERVCNLSETEHILWMARVGIAKQQTQYQALRREPDITFIDQ